jgi:hypothetical protein
MPILIHAMEILLFTGLEKNDLHPMESFGFENGASIALSGINKKLRFLEENGAQSKKKNYFFFLSI